MARSRPWRERVARLAARSVAGLVAGGAIGCTVVEVPAPSAPAASFARSPAARPAALQSFVVPGDFPFECRRMDDEQAAAMGVPRDGAALLFLLGEFPLDDRRISVGLDGAGRALWLTDATTELGGRPGQVSHYAIAVFRGDTVTGMHQVRERARPLPPLPAESDTAAVMAWYERFQPPELTPGERAAARAVAAWATTHRCDR